MSTSSIQAILRMHTEVSNTQPDKTINVEFMKLDLSSLKSVKQFTVDFKQRSLPIHLLINNAGVALVREGMCVCK